MASFVQLVIIAAVIATVYGQTYPVTSSSRDYFLISQRELQHDIEIVEVQIDSVNARYADRLHVVQQQQEELLHDIVQLNKTLMPLQALSLVRKQCIQKYDSQLVTYDNANKRMKLCYNKAASISDSLTKSAQSNVNNANYEINSVLPLNAASCDKSYEKNDTLLQECYVKHVKITTTNVNTYLADATTQLNKSLLDSSNASKTAVQCSYLVEKDSLQTMAITMQTIDQCEVLLNKQKSATVLSITGPNIAPSLIMSKLNGH